MITANVRTAVDIARRYHNLPAENYWLYIKKTGDDAVAYAEEHKNEDYIGFFVEDDSRINGILRVAESKIRRIK